MKENSVVLLSGGLDSTVNFFAAMNETNVKLCLTFDYGQRAAQKEIDAAAGLCRVHNIEHKVIELPWFKDLGQSALNRTDKIVPSGSRISIDNIEVSKHSAKAVWVPNRNGLFLNIAASFAESMGADFVVPGFNREEAQTFPDNSLDFLRSIRKAFVFSTLGKVDVQCYTIAMSKVEIVELGMKLRVPFEKIWPCYLSEEKWCGQCESCQRARRAMRNCRIDTKDWFVK